MLGLGAGCSREEGTGVLPPKRAPLCITCRPSMFHSSTCFPARGCCPVFCMHLVSCLNLYMSKSGCDSADNACISCHVFYKVDFCKTCLHGSVDTLSSKSPPLRRTKPAWKCIWRAMHDPSCIERLCAGAARDDAKLGSGLQRRPHAPHHERPTCVRGAYPSGGRLHPLRWPGHNGRDRGVPAGP